MDTSVNHVGSELADVVGIQLRYGVGGAKKIKRRYIALSGRIPQEIRYVVHNNTLINIYRALIERVFFVEVKVGGVKTLVGPPVTSRGHFYGQMADFSRKVKDNLEYARRMSLTEFVMTSPPHKKKVYQNAMDNYLRRGLAPSKSEVTSFIKAEKVRITAEKPDPAPRIIQPRSAEFNLVVGCFIRPIEKLVYKAIDKTYGRPTVCCGQNAEQMAAMLRDAWDEIAVVSGEPIALSLDLSRMDQHVSSVALRWEHTFYRHAYQHDTMKDTLDWCLSKTVSNVGRVYTYDQDGRPAKVKYTKNGSRMSGDMNTSLGNKLIMCGLLYSYFVNVCGFVPRKDFNVVDNGDDCVVIMSKQAYATYNKNINETEVIRQLAIQDPENWQRVYMVYAQEWVWDEQRGNVPRVEPRKHMPIDEWFRTMGFTLKVEGIVTKFNHIEFCQTQPCFIDGRWIMVRGLKALAKDAYCLKPLQVLKKWMSQVKGGGLATYGSVPIYSAYYKSMPGVGSKKREMLFGTGMYYLSDGMCSKQEVSTQNRVEFWETFGVTPREQEVIENIYLSMEYHEQQSLLDHAPLYLPLPVI